MDPSSKSGRCQCIWVWESLACGDLWNIMSNHDTMVQRSLDMGSLPLVDMAHGSISTQPMDWSMIHGPCVDHGVLDAAQIILTTVRD